MPIQSPTSRDLSRKSIVELAQITYNNALATQEAADQVAHLNDIDGDAIIAAADRAEAAADRAEAAAGQGGGASWQTQETDSGTLYINISNLPLRCEMIITAEHPIGDYFDSTPAFIFGQIGGFYDESVIKPVLDANLQTEFHVSIVSGELAVEHYTAGSNSYWPLRAYWREV